VQRERKNDMASGVTFYRARSTSRRGQHLRELDHTNVRVSTREKTKFSKYYRTKYLSRKTKCPKFSIIIYICDAFRDQRVVVVI
jgi:hypothetical protein